MSNCLKCPSRSFQKTQYCRRHYEEVYQISRQLRKEELIGDSLEFYLRETWSVEIVKNKKLPETEYRPDFYFVLDGYLFVIEIDENQHRQYNKKEEDLRQEKVLSQCHSLIRFNPDKYECKGQKYPAILTRELKITQPGKIVDNVTINHEEFQRRIKILFYAIEKQIQDVCLNEKQGDLCLVCYDR